MPHVAPQAFERLGAARGRTLLLQQALHAAKDHLRHIDPRQGVFGFQLRAHDFLVDGADQDFQVLAYALVAFQFQLLLQLRARLLHGRHMALGDVWPQVGGQAVVLGQARVGGVFGRELRLRRQHDGRVAVARFNPGQ
ncbi:hypothetical protein D3C72_1910400 [compost metagenome]